jgi:hypothetical protein
MRKAGWEAGVTEKWNSHARIRQDLFGWIDIIAIGGPFSEIVGIQATTGANMSARIQKLVALDTSALWEQCKGRIIVIGWRKTGDRGKRKTWKPRIVEVYNSGEPNGWLPVELELSDLTLERGEPDGE